jgi:hypothetical protein
MGQQYQRRARMAAGGPKSGKQAQIVEKQFAGSEYDRRRIPQRVG